MKSVVLFPLLISINFCFPHHAMSQSQPASKPAKNQSASVLRHVVLFKFKDSATPDQIKKVEQAFAALPGKINTIIGFEWGTNVSPENLAQGYTHCYLVTFKNAADRDAYLPHPAHKEFGQLLSPYLDKVLVVDYFSQP
ncbi:MAG: stress responsive protein [Cytophagales bacterium CG18_big_fil_WC_8_21_14_2_50_42_9]|nr:MAG: stress responsive protein [Cytophagales bacterium CG18_big_fil_WC_8_21_14_2_50_42_9]